MAERAMPPVGLASPVSRAWLRISPPLVPVLAVLTALIITIPFMIITGGEGSVSRGLNIAGTAYSALIEGATGLAINDRVSEDDFGLIKQLAAIGDGLTQRELRSLANNISDLEVVGLPAAQRFDAALAAVSNLSDDDIQSLGEKIPDIQAIGAERLTQLAPLINDLSAMDRGEARNLLEEYAAMDAISAEDRATLEASLPSAAEYDDAALIEAIKALNQEGVVSYERSLAQLQVLNDLGIAPDSVEATDLGTIATLQDGVEDARDMAGTAALLDESGIQDFPALVEQVGLIRELYSEDILTEDDVSTAIDDELQQASQ